ncbi:hypothetical protein N9949_02120 [Akkermansiaceae bacterium]|nr:hypothetical protein [Akkermansiaceae bacterium]
MSQHDYDIANQLSANLRIDLNNALKALNSNNSGVTEPTGNDSQANMLWYDTTSKILKMKPEDNAAGQWISIGYLDQSTDTFKILDDTVVATTAGVTAGLIGDQPTATWTTGTGTTESLVSPAKVKAAVLALQTGPTVVRSPAFASATLNAYSFSHGQGSVPDLVYAELKVTTAQNGYAVGDVIKINNTLELDEDNILMTLSGNATTINLASSSTNLPRYTANKSTGGFLLLSDSNVELYLVGVWF